MQQPEATLERTTRPIGPAHPGGAGHGGRSGAATRRQLDAGEGAARETLRAQVALLERRLSSLIAASFPHGGVETRVPAARAPRLLTLAELEVLRDALSERVAAGAGVLEARGREQERARVRLERMLIAPGEHRHVRIAQRDLGEGGCGVWHVRPRLGLIGMLMGWWHVKLSSGCPLAT